MGEQMKVMDQRIEHQSQFQEAHNKRFEDTLLKIMQSMNNMQQMAEVGSAHHTVGESSRSSMDSGNHYNRSLGFVPKLEFPKFDGTNSRNSIKKCTKYFDLCKNPANQKVDIASLYMIDRAEIWMSSYLSVRKQVDWDDFIFDLCAIFKDVNGVNIVEQFNRLKQLDSLENYID